jgi:GNAT superfamily N-acetyltransferase
MIYVLAFATHAFLVQLAPGALAFHTVFVFSPLLLHLVFVLIGAGALCVRHFGYSFNMFVVWYGLQLLWISTVHCKYTIRQVDTTSPEILKVIKGLHRQCLPMDEYPDFAVGQWWLVYSHTKTPIAFAGLIPSHRWANCGYLCRSGVLSFYRGQGLQKRLIRVRLIKARQIGYDYVFSDVNDNAPSANNLVDCGFRFYEPKAPYGDEKTLYLRRKP